MIENFKKSFFAFLRRDDKLTKKEKDEIEKLFHNKIIETVFSVSVYLVIWSFFVTFINTNLIARGTIRSLLHFNILGSFLPSFIFILINAVVKFLFIFFYTKKRIPVDMKHIFAGIIPVAGSFFFSAYFLKSRPKLLYIFRQYFSYIRKKMRWFFIMRGKEVD